MLRSLASVELPAAGLTSIGQHAFAFCSSLASVELPAGLTSICVADGTSDKASERCKKMLPAGAGLVKWAGNTGQVVAELKVVTSNKLCEPGAATRS